MSSLILFASRHGSVANAALILAGIIDSEVLVAQFGMDEIPDISRFDSVMIGGSIYIGKVQKEVKAFCESNIDELNGKNLGIFICAGEENPEKRETTLKGNFPSLLLDSANAKGWFGREVHIEDMGFLEKLALRFAKGTRRSYSDLREENIKEFALKMGLV